MSEHQPNSLIVIDDLHYDRADRNIFRGVNLSVEKGKITGIMGPSGTGKTTLLKLIGGQLIPESGSISYDGKTVHQMNRSDLFAMRSKMGMLFQSGALFSDMSVFENVAFPIRAHTKLSEAQIQSKVSQKLDAVGLDGTQALFPAELSGGMSRRVALARAIALDPELIMYDEPFAGQDPIVMGVLVRLIKQLTQSLSLTTIIVSHDVDETLSIADYVYVLADGVVMGEGTPESLRQSDEPFVRQFLDGSVDGPVAFKYRAKQHQASEISESGL